jgi:hypothetical protein
MTGHPRNREGGLVYLYESEVALLRTKNDKTHTADGIARGLQLSCSIPATYETRSR